MSSDGPWAEIYDLIYGNIRDDIPFYLEYAQQKGSPVLEIACGTGRVLIPFAEAGYEVWGIDYSPAMLAKAQQKVSVLPEDVSKRVHLVQADMRDFHLRKRFPLALIPFRSFLHLLTVEDQIRTLKNIRRHLKNGGFLIIDVFRPRYDYFAQDKRQESKKIVNAEIQHTFHRKEDVVYDHTNQLMNIDYTFDEHDENGNLLRTIQLSLKLRYIFRYEMEHLLRFSGFKIEAVYGTFDKKSYDYKETGEMIFVTSKT